MKALACQMLVVLAFVCAGEIKLLKTPQDSSGRQGSSLILPCLGKSYAPNAELSCAWTKDGHFVFVGKGRLRQFYEWSGIESEGDCSVLMRNLSTTHVGLWQCTMIDVNSDGDRTSSAPAYIRLLVPPSAPIIEDSGGERLADLEVLEGRTYRLHCFSRHGNPAASLSWTVGTLDITANATSYNESEPHREGSYTAGSVLSLEFARQLDGEKLRCTSKHPAKEGVIESAVLIVTVHYPPSNVSELEVNITTAIHDLLQLNCPLTSKPEPTYAWFRRSVIPGYNDIMDPEQETNIPLWSLVGRHRHIIIDNVTESDAGQYQCSATYVYATSEETSTAYSAIYTVKVLVSQPEIVEADHVTSPTSCHWELAAFAIAVAMAAFASVFFIAECALLMHARCRKQPATKFTAHGCMQELYFTRGRKMALVHAQTTPGSESGKGWALHISAAFISVLLMALDIAVMLAAAMAIYQCITPSSCQCTVQSPAVLLALAFGALVALIQFVLLLSFCIRKRAERRFAKAAKSSNGARLTSAPSSSTTDAHLGDEKVFQTRENAIREEDDGNGNVEKEEVLQSCRAENYKV